MLVLGAHRRIDDADAVGGFIALAPALLTVRVPDVVRILLFKLSAGMDDENSQMRWQDR